MKNNSIRAIGTLFVLVLSASQSLTQTTYEPYTNARFFHPKGVATDSAGNVYVADALNSTIRRVTPTGVVTTPAGSAGFFGSANGTGANARFNFPPWRWI